MLLLSIMKMSSFISFSFHLYISLLNLILLSDTKSLALIKFLMNNILIQTTFMWVTDDSQSELCDHENGDIGNFTKIINPLIAT